MPSTEHLADPINAVTYQAKMFANKNPTLDAELVKSVAFEVLAKCLHSDMTNIKNKKGWIYRCVRNELLDYAKQEHHRAKFWAHQPPIDASEEVPPNWRIEDLEDPALSPEDECIARDIYEKLHEPDKTIFRMFSMGYTAVEIAKELKTTLSEVNKAKTILFRGL